jgi:hypothetical protein
VRRSVCESTRVVTGLSSVLSGVRYAVTVTWSLADAGTSRMIILEVISIVVPSNPGASIVARQGVAQCTVNRPPSSDRPSSVPAASFAVAPTSWAPWLSCTLAEMVWLAEFAWAVCGLSRAGELARARASTATPAVELKGKHGMLFVFHCRS